MTLVGLFIVLLKILSSENLNKSMALLLRVKIIHKDLKHGMVKLRIDSAEDSWYLSSIIEPDDLLSGMTERKIKIGGTDPLDGKIAVNPTTGERRIRRKGNWEPYNGK